MSEFNDYKDESFVLTSQDMEESCPAGKVYMYDKRVLFSRIASLEKEVVALRSEMSELIKNDHGTHIEIDQILKDAMSQIDGLAESVKEINKVIPFVNRNADDIKTLQQQSYERSEKLGKNTAKLAISIAVILSGVGYTISWIFDKVANSNVGG